MHYHSTKLEVKIMSRRQVTSFSPFSSFVFSYGAFRYQQLFARIYEVMFHAKCSDHMPRVAVMRKTLAIIPRKKPQQNRVFQNSSNMISKAPK